MIEGELESGTELIGDCFLLLVDCQFVNCVDIRLGAMMNTIEFNGCVGISKWYLSTQFEEGDHIFFLII